MSRHERNGDRVLPTVISTSDGTAIAVLPRNSGRHRAIIESHAFVPHPRGEWMGCNHFDADYPATNSGFGREVRCGYYRRHHATLAVSA